MSELPLVWRKAGEPAPRGLAIAVDRHKHDTDLFYGVKDNDFLLGWAKREFGKGYIAMLSWRVTQDDVSELGRTRTLAEAKQLLEGYVYAWWLTPDAEYMRNKLKAEYEKHLQHMSRQHRTASEIAARVHNMPPLRGEGSV